MANGDDAAAAGMDVVAGTADRRQGYDEINKTRDYIAQRTSAVQPVAKGGTGATNAADARTNLDAAKTAHTHRIDDVYTSDGTQKYGTALQAQLSAMQSSLEVQIGSKVSNGANVTFGDIYTPAGRSNPVSVGWVSAALGGDGRLGASPSAARFKQDITPRTYSLDDIDRITIVTYRLIEAVEQLGDDARVEVGVIAEQLVEAGFPEFVVFGDDGQPFTVEYGRMVTVALSGIQALHAQQQDILTRLTDLEAAR